MLKSGENIELQRDDASDTVSSHLQNLQLTPGSLESCSTPVPNILPVFVKKFTVMCTGICITISDSSLFLGLFCFYQMVTLGRLDCWENVPVSIVLISLIRDPLDVQSQKQINRQNRLHYQDQTQHSVSFNEVEILLFPRHWE